MADIQVEIQGQGAIAAAQDLFSSSGLMGNYEIESEAEQEGPIATIATIVGGTVAAAEQIRNWYQEHKQSEAGKAIEKVMIIGRNGRKLLLEDATVEEIRQILSS